MFSSVCKDPLSVSILILVEEAANEEDKVKKCMMKQEVNRTCQIMRPSVQNGSERNEGAGFTTSQTKKVERQFL